MNYLIILITFISYSVFSFETGERIPEFEAVATEGKIKLSQFKGKIVVLEWLNHGCPFVRKHYDSGNMQKLQKKYTDQKVIWLSVISSASGKQGHVDQAGALKDKKENKSFASDIILDSEGKLGKMFEAKTTPHLFIINREGILAYQGAIDDRADADIESVPLAKNYILMALDEILSSKKISIGTTKAYGCSVKY
jgi:alkyl hydroperoxide reductase subunit AhpC